MEAIILAGGLGLRLRRLFPQLPKPLAPVNGEPFLAHLLRYWERQGIERFILSVGYRASIIEATFGKRWGRASITYAKEPNPLGTGGAVLNSLPAVRAKNFVLINGDTFLAADLKGLVGFHREKRADASLLVRKHSADNRYGQVEIDAEGRVTNFSASAASFIYSGVSLWAKAIFLGHAAADIISLEKEILPLFVAQGQRIFGAWQQVPFVDIGIPKDYRKAAAIIDSLENPSDKRSHERHPTAT